MLQCACFHCPPDRPFQLSFPLKLFLCPFPATARQALLAKQGRASQFASQEERDQHLRGQVAKLEKAAAKHAQQRTQLQAQEQEVTTTMMNASSVSRVNKGQQRSTIHGSQSD